MLSTAILTPPPYLEMEPSYQDEMYNNKHEKQIYPFSFFVIQKKTSKNKKQKVQEQEHEQEQDQSTREYREENKYTL